MFMQKPVIPLSWVLPACYRLVPLKNDDSAVFKVLFPFPMIKYPKHDIYSQRRHLNWQHIRSIHLRHTPNYIIVIMYMFNVK